MRLLPRLVPILGLLIGLLAENPASAAHSDSPPEWSWLSEADKTRLLESIPPAPEANSDADRKDVAQVLKVQASRTPAEVAEAQADQHFSFDLVTRILSIDFTSATYPVSYALLQRVDDDEYLLNSTLKKRYHRLRPYQTHPEVKPLFAVEQYSYPSGHSSGAHTLATILSQLFPDKKGALQARADSIGQGRVIAGVHYPSDVEEGKKLAQALTDALLANSAFQKDLAAAKTEVLQRRAKP